MTLAEEETSVQKGGQNERPVRRFTWKELSKLNKPENAHVAVRGKVESGSKNFTLLKSLSLSLSLRCMM